MSSYGHIAAQAYSRGKPVTSKKIANNTYAERYIGNGSLEEPDAVGIRLHNTVVVKYTKTGELVLDTGGWKTVTTKDRINSYTPNWVRVFSEKGEWRVATRPWGEERPSVPYADGITLEINSLAGIAWTPVPGTYPDETQERLAAEAKKKLTKDVNDYLAKADKSLAVWKQQLHDTGQLSTAGDCWFCLGIVQDFDGNQSTSHDHLWQHLRDGYVLPSLFLTAYRAKNYRNPEIIFTSDLSYRDGADAKKTLRNYLIKTLGASAEPKTNNALVEQYLEQAREVLERPSDFGYFGGDENLWVASAPTFSKNRASSNLDLANFDIVWEALKAEFPELFPDSLDEDGYPERDFSEWPAIYVFGARHWAVGHIDQIVVPVKLDPLTPLGPDNLHPAFIKVCEYANEVRSYPALDGAEERADTLNAEQITKGVQRYVGYLDDERVTPYAEKITQWWITREVFEGEEEFGYWTDDILKAHVAVTEIEAYTLQPAPQEEALF